MRLVGFFLRSAIITAAFLGFTIVIIGGLMFIALWMVLPVLLVDLILNGVTAILS